MSRIWRKRRAPCLALSAALALGGFPFSVLAQEVSAGGDAISLQDGESVAADAEESFEFLTEEEEEMQSLEKELSEAFSVFGMLFPSEPLTPEQEEALPLATQMASKIMPNGAMATALESSIKPMMDMMTEEVTANPRTRLAEVSGVELEDLEGIDDQAASDALNIFDPDFAFRTKAMADGISNVVTRLFAAMEPAYRDALARAFVTRFDKVEMQDLLAFFETDLGSKFARESYLVHYDPAMLSAMEQMGPAIAKSMPEFMEEFEAIEKVEEAEREVRGFSELGAAERERVAELIGKPQSELDALEPQVDVEVLEEDADTSIT